jgi:hypothetical protein
MHIKEKAASAICAMADIQSLSKLSLETAIKLFFKIAPILTYGLSILWEHLGENSPKTLESEKRNPKCPENFKIPPRD